MSDANLASMLEECSNAGRWGHDDELGTLNYVTPEKRVAAARLVTAGRVVAIGKPLSPHQSGDSRAAHHLMLFDDHPPPAALDYQGIAPHSFSVTHLDAVAHTFWEGRCYNGRRVDDVLSSRGLAFGSIHAQREGVFTRGVFLDVAEARGVPWLQPADYVRPEDLEVAERKASVRAGTGDAVFVHIGQEARLAELGESDPFQRAGLHADSVRWLHQREVAIYAGDCVEHIPYPSASVPLPLHQVGQVAMGLILLDAPSLAELRSTCAQLNRWEFLFVCSPTDFLGATGMAVNPLCVF